MIEILNHEPPKSLGDFEILRELGLGGMGVVYKARQKSLDRHVTREVLSSRLGLTAKAVLRLRREADVAAKLHHTNIVPIISCEIQISADDVREEFS